MNILNVLHLNKYIGEPLCFGVESNGSNEPTYLVGKIEKSPLGGYEILPLLELVQSQILHNWSLCITDELLDEAKITVIELNDKARAKIADAVHGVRTHMWAIPQNETKLLMTDGL